MIQPEKVILGLPDFNLLILIFKCLSITPGIPPSLAIFSKIKTQEKCSPEDLHMQNLVGKEYVRHLKRISYRNYVKPPIVKFSLENPSTRGFPSSREILPMKVPLNHKISPSKEYQYSSK